MKRMSFVFINVIFFLFGVFLLLVLQKMEMMLNPKKG